MGRAAATEFRAKFAQSRAPLLAVQYRKIRPEPVAPSDRADPNEADDGEGRVHRETNPGRSPEGVGATHLPLREPGA